MGRLNAAISWDTLEAQKWSILTTSLAGNTHRSYNVGIKQYMVVCAQMGLSPLPLTPDVVENFCVALSHRVGVKSIKVYLCGIQHWSLMFGFDNKLSAMLRLPYVLRGIRRRQGSTHTRPPRLPITLAHLRCILHYLRVSLPPYDCTMLTAAVLTAFFGLLRVSEYTSPTTSRFDSTVHLTLDDVHINWIRRLVYLRIKASKTDPFRLGVTIRLGATNNFLCPVHAMLRYIMIRGVRWGPLFMFGDYNFLTRAHITTLLRHSLPRTPNVNTHSFRRGGASALAAVGTPTYVIQIMGRWRSDAYIRYVTFSDEFILNANRIMAHPDSSRDSGLSNSSGFQLPSGHSSSEFRI